MKKLASILLFGVLSMFFAEVCSGASTLWFVNFWGLFVTMPLYLGHALFFFNCAVRFKRTSVRQLYFFGMMFGLYEALITKVLWFGYPGSTASMFGTIGGVAWGEFLSVVLFWHPVMSFLVPIFVYELLSRDILPGHEKILQKNWRTILGVVLLVVIAANLQNNGASYNLLVSFGSVAGALLIIFILNWLTKTKTLQSLTLGNTGMILLSVYLIILYASTTILILPERLPQTILPYLLILLWYLVVLGLLWIDSPTNKLTAKKKNLFSTRDLFVFAILLAVVTVVFALFSQISQFLLVFFALVIVILGGVFLLASLLSLLRQKLKENALNSSL